MSPVGFHNCVYSALWALCREKRMISQGSFVYFAWILVECIFSYWLGNKLVLKTWLFHSPKWYGDGRNLKATLKLEKHKEIAFYVLIEPLCPFSLRYFTLYRHCKKPCGKQVWTFLIKRKNSGMVAFLHCRLNAYHTQPRDNGIRFVISTSEAFHFDWIGYIFHQHPPCEPWFQDRVL